MSKRPVPDASSDTPTVFEFTKKSWKRYGGAVIAARTMRRLTLRELADKLQVPHQTLHRLEAGGPVRRDTLLKVERWLKRLTPATAA